MGKTVAEKILARASGSQRIKPDDYVVANIDLAMIHDAWSFVGPILENAGVSKVWDSEKIVTVFDHFNPPPTLKDAEAYKTAHAAVRKYGVKHFYGQNAGICHQVFMEKGHILPGMLVVGTDSHTMTYGALGAAGASLGFSEMAYAATFGKLWFKVPKTIRFTLNGKLNERVSAKDVIIWLAGKYSVNAAQYMSVEYYGQTVSDMDIAGRMTLANMTAEIGAKYAFTVIDEKVDTYLECRAKGEYFPAVADSDAVYEAAYVEDVSALEPQVACPYSVDNAKAVSALGDVHIDQAVLGSCTNGRLEDLREAAAIIRGRKVHPDVNFMVIPASTQVYADALHEGLIEEFIDAGAVVCHSCCGPCNGGHLGLLAPGQVCISSTSRNFKNRMGAPGSEVYLASPATVAASAVSGRISDPREL
jgi:3-isopropylmalate/(R)-2-methylmalate dehydratase large subunit